MSRIIFSLISLLFLSNSLAANTVTVTITPPTQRADGELLPLSEIANYELEQAVGSCTAAFTKVATIPVANAAGFLLTNVSVGTKCYRAIVVDTSGLKSDPSNTASVKILAPPGKGSISVVIKVTP